MKQHQNTLHSEKVILNGKAFFLDLRKAKNDASYLVISQTKPVEDDKFERIKMILFENEIQKFSEALNNTLEHFTPKGKSAPTEAELAKLRETYPMAFQPWTKEDEELLITLFNEGKSIKEMSEGLKRQEGAINARLSKLGLNESASAA